MPAPDPPTKPEAAPPPCPTYAPIAMAMGVAMTFWGLMALTFNINAMWFMSVAGVGLVAWSLKSWIHEIVLVWEANR
ncbi:hypothetical protein KOR34_02910 [Posidoniimonas corsicana]|uniref:Uncharacterized protein n=1 Tax=Posidoniimonas corsicana TaxID=1938618 RepID=A0A5C5VBK8_9BACT|nr:hypothetical protein [Posidoniimonas corsicana]TWT35400.1 hypothetical protein KOR34_02910 [Posidoniimonas corsicana]